MNRLLVLHYTESIISVPCIIGVYKSPPPKKKKKNWAPDGRHELSSTIKTHKNSPHRINFSCQGERLTRGLCTPVHLCPTGGGGETLFWTFFISVSYKELLQHFVHAQTDPRRNLPATAQVSQCYGRENKDTALLARLRQEISEGKPVPAPVPLLCTESGRQVCVYRSSVSFGVENNCLTTLCTSSKAVHQFC